jgi:uncharacterized protein (DUF697 family)
VKHPNAFAAAITAGLAALILKVAKHYGYAHLTNEQALGIAGGAIVAVLFIGRRVVDVGLKGVLQGIWNGARKVTVGPKPTTTVAQPVPPPAPPSPTV